MNTITFPNLNLEFNINPVAFTIFRKRNILVWTYYSKWNYSGTYSSL